MNWKKKAEKCQAKTLKMTCLQFLMNLYLDPIPAETPGPVTSSKNSGSIYSLTDMYSSSNLNVMDRQIRQACMDIGCINTSPFYVVYKTWNVWTHAQQYGLQAKYTEEAKYAHNIRMLMALAYVPTDEVNSTFNILAESPFWEDSSEKEYNAQKQALINPLNIVFKNMNSLYEFRQKLTLKKDAEMFLPEVVEKNKTEANMHANHEN
ncbi:hypothetical protein Bhyg_03797 [Pseudolycoriella hygida]|uniref:Uncharacterized protein n=1 Tax=Pseudolycoriella hygida TaxID=35572 RepID=A0A9Q0NEP1_9DIPT|nr:hypothetical protein Bhyg_03797 [Pseudolycoriella hygida]